MPQTLENGSGVSLCNSNAGLRAEATKTEESKLVDKKNRKRKSSWGKRSELGFEKNAGYRFLCTEELGGEEHCE